MDNITPPTARRISRAWRWRMGALLCALVAAAASVPARAQDTVIYLPVVAAAESTPGIWCWFGNPRALHYSGIHDRTYWGAVDQQGDVRVFAYDHDDGRLQSSILHAGLEANDHASPSLLVRDDGRLVVYYSVHNGPDIYQRISSRAEDITAWGAEQSLDAALGGSRYTYPSPVQLTGEPGSPIYLFFRDFHPVPDAPLWRDTFVSKSLDGGLTWSAQQPLFVNEGKRPYVHIARNGASRIDFAVTDGEPSETAINNLYHFYYQDGQYHRSDGSVITPGPPFAPAQGTRVWDGAGGPAWGWDLAIDSEGRPMIAFAVIRSPDDHRYHAARWNGAAWVDAEITQGGGTFYAPAIGYSGGIAIDRSNLDRVYVSRQVAGQWEIWSYATADGGRSWGQAEPLTWGSTAINARPVSPLDAHPGLRVIWWQGEYRTWKDFNTTLRSYPLLMQ